MYIAVPPPQSTGSSALRFNSHRVNLFHIAYEITSPRLLRISCGFCYRPPVEDPYSRAFAQAVRDASTVASRLVETALSFSVRMSGLRFASESKYDRLRHLDYNVPEAVQGQSSYDEHKWR